MGHLDQDSRTELQGRGLQGRGKKMEQRCAEGEKKARMRDKRQRRGEGNR